MSAMEEQQQRSYYPPSHQPPVSQQSQEPRPQRARTQSHFSFKSNRSNSSSNNGSRPAKEHLKETVTEKRKNRISQTTKANPNAAMVEAQPAVQAMEASTLGTLRSGTLRDIHGNLITDPDRSNPTRSRMERPLDTIRSFDEQIEKNYWEKRQSIYGANGFENNSGNSSRRNSGHGFDSYFAGRQSHNGYSTPGGYYRSNDSYYDSYSSSQFHPPRRYHPGGRPSHYGRGTSPHDRNPHGIYPNQGYHQSLDTVNTGASGSGSGSGSGSQGFSNSEMWAGSADTSIEDGSVGMHRKDPSSGLPADPYAYDQGYASHNGWNTYRRSNGSPERQPAPAVQSPYQDQQYPSSGYHAGSYGNGGYGGQVDRPPPPPKHPSNGYAHPGPNGAAAPASPPKSNTLQPVRTAASGGGLAPSASTKRKSWFKRRFSKN